MPRVQSERQTNKGDIPSTKQKPSVHIKNETSYRDNRETSSNDNFPAETRSLEVVLWPLALDGLRKDKVGKKIRKHPRANVSMCLLYVFFGEFD